MIHTVRTTQQRKGVHINCSCGWARLVKFQSEADALIREHLDEKPMWASGGVELESAPVTTQAIMNNWTPKTRREYQRTQRGPSSAQSDLFDTSLYMIQSVL